MGIFKRIQTAITDLAVHNAEVARHRPRLKLMRALANLIAALYILYYVMVTRGGFFAQVASVFLFAIPAADVMTHITRYLYLRGHRTARSVRGKLLK